jgi:hypothetical protein
MAQGEDPYQHITRGQLARVIDYLASKIPEDAAIAEDVQDIIAWAREQIEHG